MRVGLLFFGLLSGCGASTAPHQAPRQTTGTADAPRAIIDAGAAPSFAIVDAGVASPNAQTDGGDAVANANDEQVDAGPRAPTHPPVHLPGKCVDALANAKQRAKLPPGADLFIEPTRVDLDGDGVDDLIYTTDANTEYSGNVYITRGSCGVMVLAWRGSQPIPLETSTLGFLDLEEESICRPGCCPTRTVTTYKWNGSDYLKGKPRVVKHQCAFGGTP